MTNSRILIADSNETSSYLLKEELVGLGYRADIVYSTKKILEKLKKSRYDLLLLDSGLLDNEDFEILKYLRSYYSTILILLIVPKSQIRNAQKYLSLGVYDLITRPHEHGLIGPSIERALAYRSVLTQNNLLSLRIGPGENGNMIGENVLIKDLILNARRAAESDSNILIEGEPGTEKKKLAEFIHRFSARSDKSFAAIDCSAKPDQLLETEIFGRENNPAVNFHSGNQGFLEIASEGTLLLEEVGRLKLSIQTDLLHFLETGEFHRYGSSTNIGSSVRIIATTSKKLAGETLGNNFLQDLLSKIAPVSLTIPPLRERGGDILLITEYLLQKKSPAGIIIKLSTDAKKKLLNYNFPGNATELEMIIDRAILLCEDGMVKAKDLTIADDNDNPAGISDDQKIMTLSELEKRHISQVLEYYDWNREKSARTLGISQKTLYTKIRTYGLK
jgi:DNA-binding NtrC family response regulator